MWAAAEGGKLRSQYESKAREAAETASQLAALSEEMRQARERLARQGQEVQLEVARQMEETHHLAAQRVAALASQLQGREHEHEELRNAQEAAKRYETMIRLLGVQLTSAGAERGKLSASLNASLMQLNSAQSALREQHKRRAGCPEESPHGLAADLAQLHSTIYGGADVPKLPLEFFKSPPRLRS